MKFLLKLLTAFVSITAVAGGILMIMEPRGSLLHISPHLLGNAPFSDFLLPGLVLTIAVGGVNGMALISQFSSRMNWYNWTLSGAVVLLIFILVQIFLIGALNLLQLFYLLVGGFMILLCWQLKGKWAV